MSHPLSLRRLIELVGDDEVRIQFLSTCMTNIVAKKKETLVTFATDQVHPNHVMMEEPPMTGMVLWLPTDLVKKARAAHEQESRP